MAEYKQYQRTAIAEIADWTPDMDMTDVSISEADRKAGSPKPGDKIARNPKNHADRWLIAADYFAENFAAAPQQRADAGHSCSYYCTRPECIRAQRDELRDRLEAQQTAEPAAFVCEENFPSYVQVVGGPSGAVRARLPDKRKSVMLVKDLPVGAALYASTQPRITASQIEQIKRLASLLETRVRAVYVLADDDEDRESLNDDVAETSAALHAALDALVKP